MWDGVIYDSDDQAQQVMEGYAKDGFEVQKFVEDRPIPGLFPAGGDGGEIRRLMGQGRRSGGSKLIANC